jgi:hypothetical protein
MLDKLAFTMSRIDTEDMSGTTHAIDTRHPVGGDKANGSKRGASTEEAVEKMSTLDASFGEKKANVAAKKAHSGPSGLALSAPGPSTSAAASSAGHAPVRPTIQTSPEALDMGGALDRLLKDDSTWERITVKIADLGNGKSAAKHIALF